MGGGSRLHLPSDRADDDWLCVDVQALLGLEQAVEQEEEEAARQAAVVREAGGPAGSSSSSGGGGSSKWGRGLGFGAMVTRRGANSSKAQRAVQ